MKRLLIASLVLLGVSVALADRFPPGALVSSKRAAAGGGSCSTTRDTLSGTIGDARVVGQYFDKRAVQFTAGGTYTICKAVLKLAKVGSPTGYNLSVQIYTDSAGSPGTQVGTGSGNLDAGTLTTSPTFSDAEFTGMSASLTSGTTYWLVVSIDTVVDGNQVNWGSSGYSRNQAYYLTGSWTVEGTDYDLNYTLYSN